MTQKGSRDHGTVLIYSCLNLRLEVFKEASSTWETTRKSLEDDQERGIVESRERLCESSNVM